MIECKPKNNYLFSMSAFIVLLISLGVFCLSIYLRLSNPPSYAIIGMFSAFPLAGILLLRLMFTYKIVNAKKKKIEVRYPLIKYKKHFSLDQLKFFNEDIIKATKEDYKRLDVQFENGRLKISIQEYSNYEKFKKHIIKHTPNIQKK